MIIEKTHNVRTCPFVRDRPWLVAQVRTLAGVLGFLVLDEDSGTHRGLSFKGAASSRMKLCACPHPSPLSQRPDSRFLLVMAQQSLPVSGVWKCTPAWKSSRPSCALSVRRAHPVCGRRQGVSLWVAGCVCGGAGVVPGPPVTSPK